MSAPYVSKRVIVEGTSRADLNGSSGWAVDYNRESCRYNVRLDAGNTIALKPSNLREAPDQSGSPPGPPSNSGNPASNGASSQPVQNRWLIPLLVGLAGWWLLQQFSGSGGGGGGSGLWAGSSDEIEYDDRDQGFMRGQVHEVATLDQLRGALAYHSDNTGLPVVVDFFSHSCGPCRMIAPAFKRIAKMYEGRVAFLKVDVNRNYEAASACSIRGMPTFQFYLNKKQVHQFSGADERGLRHHTMKVVDRAEEQGIFVGKYVNASTLRTFYEENDPEKAKDAEKLATKYEHKTAQLMRVCKQKYASTPALSQRHTDEKSGETSRSQKQNDKKGASSCKNLESVSMEDLLAELEHRRAADVEKQGDLHEIFEYPDAIVGRELRLAIIGGGPAGLAAALYAARAGLKPAVIAPVFGGQLLGKGVDVENYPGVVGEAANGRGLVELMRQQAKSFDACFIDSSVLQADFSSKPLKLWLNGTDKPVHTQAVIIACGADPRWLKVDGEDAYKGKGVSACATCDGFLYRDKDVSVIGGGDTAMEDALHLARSSKHVTVIHRRDKLRASKLLADNALNNPRISIRWNTTVESFHGKSELSHLILKTLDGTMKRLDTDAAFVAIGHDPQTSFLRSQLDMDSSGYVKLWPSVAGTATSVPGVFAAGDVADHTYRQAITASGTGAMAALDAERYLNDVAPP